MWSLFVMLFILTVATDSKAANMASQWSMGFWNSSEPQPNGTVPITSVDFTKLTHLIEVTTFVNSDGTLAFNCSNISYCTEAQMASEIRTVVSTAHAANVKVLLDVATRWDGQIGWVGATSPANLSRFITNIMSVVNTYGYDGVDIDWEETPVQQQTANLIIALRTALGNKILTADALAEDQKFWATVASNLDRINIMTYDLDGCDSYKVMWFNSPIYSDSNQYNWSLDLAAQRAISAGISPAKINLGIPFYGYVNTGVSSPRTVVSAKCKSTSLNYNQILATYNVSSPIYDATTQEPWLPINNGYLTFENPTSVASHVSYIQNKQLGGWIIWNLQDDYVLSTPTHPLLAALPTVSSGVPSTGSQ